MSLVSLVLIVVLVLLLIGVVPVWPHANGWGYGPSGLLFVLLVMPECVSTREWVSPQGTPAEAVELKGGDPGRLIYACINAIKELNDQIAALKAQLPA